MSRRTKKRRIQQAVAANLQQIQRQVLASSISLVVTQTDQDQICLEPDIQPTATIVNENASESLALEVQNNYTENSLNVEIRKWALGHNLTRVALNDLLSILKVFLPGETLPSDSRTLLETPRRIELVKVDGGHIYHFGIRKNLEKCIQRGLSDFRLHNVTQLGGISNLITITVGIDGLPISRSSRKQFWPILGYVDQQDRKSVFVISMYYGDEVKPGNLNEFLKFFIDEALQLEKGFQVGEKFYNFRVRCIIADAPARSFVKSIKGHNGYYGCERCYRKGKHVRGRLLYNFKEDEVLHTDDTFASRLHHKHHNEGEASPLTKLQLGIISQIPADYMHLCCLGVMKKMLCMWKDGPLPHKLLPRLSKRISKRLIGLRNCTPKEFNRKPRSLDDLKNWKATEFRTFMLYVGPVVLVDILNADVFNHFMLFHTAMYVLISNAAFNHKWVDFANQLLEKFNESFSTVYSRDCMVYNVHMLKHLCQNSYIHGPLDRISAFPFENHMQHIKRLLRKKNTYLTQIVKRSLEREFLEDSQKPLKASIIEVSKQEKDNCFITNDNRVCVLVSNEDNSAVFKVKYFNIQSDAKIYPCKSSTLMIHYVEGEGNTSHVNQKDLSRKCFKMPYKQGFLCIPLCNSEL